MAGHQYHGNPDAVVIDRVNGTTEDVVIRFDCLNVSADNLRLEVLDGTGTRGIRLDLDNGGTVQNKRSSAPADNGGLAQLEFTSTNHASRLLLRSNANFGFEGTWRANGGLIHPEQQTDGSGSDDQVEGELLNDGGLRLSHTSYGRIAVSLVGDGFLMASSASTDGGEVATLATGLWANHGDIYGSGNLTVTSNNDYGKLLVNGDISHTGDTTVDNKSAGMTLELGSTSTYAFYPGGNGVNNQINGLSAVNSALNANGAFVISTGGAFSTHCFLSSRWMF
jgi:hypothetical protein